MVIKEVNITSFGKIQNKKYTFSQGINVIYGENEAGKTTLQQFIKSMLFGLEKKRGRSTVSDEYQKFEPWENPACFSGRLIFETGGQQFLLERNFYHKEATARLVNMGDLEELSVEKGDLEMLLGGVTKAAYENTYCISQEKVLPQEELGIMLGDERANLTQTRDASFQLSQALDKLMQKKKQFEKQKKELETERQRQIGQLRSRQQLLEEQMEQMGKKVLQQKEREAVLEQQMREKKAREVSLDEECSMKEPEIIECGHDLKRQWNPLVILGVAGALLLQMMISWMEAPKMPCRVGQVVFAVVVIVGIIRTIKWNAQEDRDREQKQENNRIELSLKKRELQDQQKECYMEYRAAQAARETMEQELQEQEVLLENNRQEQKELEMTSIKEQELEQEIDSISLAADTMQRLASGLAEETDDFINGRMSQIISAITEGKYDDLRLENSSQLCLTDNYHKRKPENYSQATMQQMYFAYRMAAGEMLAKEEPLPFLLDEAFSSYDEKRLKEVLGWLAAQERQVLIFTCRRLESEILQEMGKNFSEISM